MKKTITILIAFILSISIYAQNTPEKFTYQAVFRNTDNTLAISQEVGISILKTSSSGTVAYEETQTPTTNANGLLTIKIGGGDNKTCSISSIDWGADTYYIKTEISLQNNGTYDISSTPTQLLSVPYALHAKTADNATTYTSGNGIYITGNAIAVKPVSTGSTTTANGLKVKTGSGITIDGTGAITTEPTYAVGDQVLGGYVFYITDGGKHGLVVASQNIKGPKITFSDFIKSLTDPTAFDVEGKRYTDWRIPTKYEMKNIYNISRGQNGATQVYIGSFNSSGYWTSSESTTDALLRYRINLTDGTSTLASIAATFTYYARAIRSF